MLMAQQLMSLLSLRFPDFLGRNRHMMCSETEELVLESPE